MGLHLWHDGTQKLNSDYRQHLTSLECSTGVPFEYVGHVYDEHEARSVITNNKRVNFFIVKTIRFLKLKTTFRH